MTAVGFIGLGNMGRPMAGNVARGGYQLVCFDAAGTSDRAPDGALIAASAGDVFASADTVLLSVPDGAATAAIADELVAAADRRVTAVVDLSTVGPRVAAEVAERLGAVGVTYADGPVSGGVAGARAATLSMMFAGPAVTLDANLPILQAIARNVFNVGTRPGQGQAMKLLNNYLSATALAATSEAVAFGLAEGLDMDVVLDVLNASTGRNSATADKFPNRIVTGSFDAGFHTRLMAKDVHLYLESAARCGVPTTVAASVSELWQRTDEALPGSDFTQIWQYVSGR